MEHNLIELKDLTRFIYHLGLVLVLLFTEYSWSLEILLQRLEEVGVIKRKVEANGFSSIWGCNSTEEDELRPLTR